MQRKAARDSERHWWVFGDRQEQLMKGVAYALSLFFAVIALHNDWCTTLNV